MGRGSNVFDAIEVVLQSIAVTVLVRTLVVPAILGRIPLSESIPTYLTEELSLFARIAV